MWNRWYLRWRVWNVVFCKNHASEGPTEEDAILRDFNSAAFSGGEEFREEQDIQNQLLLAMAASLGYMTTGLVRGFSSPGVPSMQQISPHLVPDESAFSWISSIPPCGAFLGSLCAGPLMQLLGRRRTLMLSSPLWVLAWCLIALAQNYEMMLFARMFTGFCVGLVTPSAAVYVSECSYAEIRGILGSLPALFMAGGILLSYMLGAWLPWNQLAWASAVFPGLLLFVMIPLPESPTWLLSKGHIAEAEKSLKWLHHQPRSPNDSIPVERQQMSVYTITAATKQHSVSSNERSVSFFSSKEHFRRPVLVPFALTFTLLIFQQVSGIDTIIFYTVSIFHSAGSQIDDHLATILVGLVQLIANFVSLFIVDRAGRRPLLIASGALMCVALLALGTHFHLQKYGMDKSFGLLPLVSLMVFMVGFSIGYCSIPFLLMGELIPEKQRSFLSSIAGSLNLGIMFIVIKTYHDLQNSVGEDGAFWLYSAVCLCSCFFVYFLVPETKGKSLAEIEEFFELTQISKRNNNKNMRGEQHASEPETTIRTTEETTKTASADESTKSTVTPTEENKSAPAFLHKISVVAGGVD